MIPLINLQFLAAQKVKDANVLFKHGRNAAAIYLMGYALEFSLKRKISQTFGFLQGFPETRGELNAYMAQQQSPIIAFPSLQQIRNHRLNDLLIYSGFQTKITAQLYTEWTTVSQWNPEDRYVRSRITAKRAQNFLGSAKLILAEIL